LKTVNVPTFSLRERLIPVWPKNWLLKNNVAEACIAVLLRDFHFSCISIAVCFKRESNSFFAEISFTFGESRHRAHRVLARIVEREIEVSTRSRPRLNSGPREPEARNLRRTSRRRLRYQRGGIIRGALVIISRFCKRSAAAALCNLMTTSL
jgi:hypothetical protein